MGRRRPKQYRLKIRSASKNVEKDLMNKAKVLADHPEMIIPECVEKCATCPWEKTKFKLEKIATYKGDKLALKRFTDSWFATTGNQLARAYAGTIGLALEKEIPRVQTINLPTGTATYVQRGKAQKEKLMGLQHFDDPQLRLFAYKDVARKLNYFLFSTEENIYCSGRTGRVPDDYVDYALSKLEYRLDASDEDNKHIEACSHLASSQEEMPHLRLYWPKAKLSIEICDKCLKSNSNMPTTLLSAALIPKGIRPFRLSISPGTTCENEVKGCSCNNFVQIPSDMQEKYLAGELSDRDFYTKVFEASLKELENSDEVLYIAGRTCYSKDQKAFIESLGPQDYEYYGIKALLKVKKGPVYVEEPTPGKLFSKYWEDYGEELLGELLGDEKRGTQEFEKSKGRTPQQVLQKVRDEIKKGGILAKLPNFTNLSPVARLADEASRAWIAIGQKSAIKLFERAKSSDPKSKALNFAFLKAAGQETGTEWKFTKEEVDFGTFLANFVTKVIEEKETNYEDNFRQLIQALGLTENILKS